MRQILQVRRSFNYLLLSGLMMILVSLSSSNAKATCPSDWIQGGLQTYYGSCLVIINYEYRFDDNCVIQIRNYSWNIPVPPNDEACHNLMNYPTVDFINFVYEQALACVVSLMLTPPCDSDPPAFLWVESKLLACSQLVGWPDLVEKLDCGISRTCVQLWTYCKEDMGGWYEYHRELYSSYIIPGPNCDAPPIGTPTWYDANNNIIEGNPWADPDNIVWPVHTNCANWSGCY